MPCVGALLDAAQCRPQLDAQDISVALSEVPGPRVEDVDFRHRHLRALELRVVEFASRGLGLSPGADELARKTLEDRIAKLEGFSDLARDVAVALRGRLASPDVDEGDAAHEGEEGSAVP